MLSAPLDHDKVCARNLLMTLTLCVRGVSILMSLAPVTTGGAVAPPGSARYQGPLHNGSSLHLLSLGGRPTGGKTSTYSAPEEYQVLSHMEEPDLNPPSLIIYWLWIFRQITHIV